MAPDKKWMDLINDRIGNEYGKGVEKFLDYAFERLGPTNEIRCPCVKCVNVDSGSRELVQMHLIVYGILQNYRLWYHDGEREGEPLENEEGDNDFMEDILRDLHPQYGQSSSNAQNLSSPYHVEEANEEAKKFYRLLDDSRQHLYQGSGVSKSSALLKLLHLKNIGQWTNESFTMLLKLLKEEILPENSTFSDSYYEAKKFIRDIGLSYEKIDTCKNDCMLFCKDSKYLDSCRVCGLSRWNDEINTREARIKANGKKNPNKILRYFPLSPKLQRMFMCSKTAPYMRWHCDARIDDEVLRHPADSMAWKSFDKEYTNFSLESRNV
ncbi:uncharacterized protein LOC124943518 [Impatiens glandulifera]|uniref:uncharacterized protein LOC124943518 n=1 Tax=Impatiens glandulifera TaxID=253017 RepID=UPI001FB18151|nr:uncharacterized protein LOC124943518 [Impatiens glandulifera]